MAFSWYQAAKNVIAATHDDLPRDISFADRKKTIANAYPFGERRYFPYKAWLKAQREYLRRYDPKPAGPLHAAMMESPLDRAKRIAGEIEEMRALRAAQ